MLNRIKSVADLFVTVLLHIVLQFLIVYSAHIAFRGGADVLGWILTAFWIGWAGGIILRLEVRDRARRSSENNDSEH